MQLREKYQAMLDGHTLVDDDGSRAWFDPALGFLLRDHNLFVAEPLEVSILRMDTPTPWRIATKRTMTREEAIALLERTPFAVVRFGEVGPWHSPGAMEKIYFPGYQWTTWRPGEFPGEPHKFETEA